MELGSDPRPKGCKKLKGREAYRIRVADYRIIYEIYDSVLLVDVIDLGHRKDIYSKSPDLPGFLFTHLSLKRTNQEI